MATPPLRTEIAGTPTNAEAKAGFGKLWDYVTGLLGATGDPEQARSALKIGEVGFKNRIINGAMMIDQRNSGSSVTANQAVYFVDRWTTFATQTSKATVQQSSTAPSGFSNSFVYTSSSAYSVTSSDYFGFGQQIEGNNIADLSWGTSSASPVTLSFWVRSSLTGTFGGSLRNNAGDRSYPFSYTINSANTWEQKSVTISGDTSGTWLTTSGIGIRLIFSMGAGSTFLGTSGAWAGANYLGSTGQSSVVGTSGATFYITGIQFEKGSVATSFDYRPYGTEFALCQRYFQIFSGLSFNSYATAGGGSSRQTVSLPVVMRSTPTPVTITAPGTVVNLSDTDLTGNVSSTAVAYGGVSVGTGRTYIAGGVYSLSSEL